MDVTMALSAFEVINSCRITMEVRILRPVDDACLEWEAHAWTIPDPSLDQLLLASTRLKLGSSDRRTADAVMFQLMYDLDAELARKEFEVIPPKKA